MNLNVDLAIYYPKSKELLLNDWINQHNHSSKIGILEPQNDSRSRLWCKFSLDNFIGKRVICTVKLDGENTSIYPDHTHARSLDSANHPSRDWLKKFAAEFQHNLPEGFRVCGENLYAKHSIGYDDLESYFYGFSMWDENNICLSWDETVEWFQLLGVTPVQVLYDGIFSEGYIKTLFVDDGSMEGYVVRLADAFSYEDFGKSVAKFVRKNHVTTGTHWLHQEIVPNKLKGM
jgi:hypothetical protein